MGMGPDWCDYCRSDHKTIWCEAYAYAAIEWAVFALGEVWVAASLDQARETMAREATQRRARHIADLRAKVDAGEAAKAELAKLEGK